MFTFMSSCGRKLWWSKLQSNDFLKKEKVKKYRFLWLVFFYVCTVFYSSFFNQYLIMSWDTKIRKEYQLNLNFYLFYFYVGFQSFLHIVQKFFSVSPVLFCRTCFLFCTCVLLFFGCMSLVTLNDEDNLLLFGGFLCDAHKTSTVNVCLS